MENEFKLKINRKTSTLVAIVLVLIFGALSGKIGYQSAHLLDVSIAGCMAVVIGLLFAFVFVFEPSRGLIGVLVRKNQNRKEYAETTLLLHVCNHQNNSNKPEENGINTIAEHLHLDQKSLRKPYVSTQWGKSDNRSCIDYRNPFRNPNG